VLHRCRKLSKQIDPTDRTATAFGYLVGRILGERWAAGPFTPAGNDRHRIAVSYPTESLNHLAEWASRQPKPQGRKPGENRDAIAKRLDQLHSGGVPWKEMAPKIEAEFGVLLKWRSLRTKWARWRQLAKSDTD